MKTHRHVLALGLTLAMFSTACNKDKSDNGAKPPPPGNHRPEAEKPAASPVPPPPKANDAGQTAPIEPPVAPDVAALDPLKPEKPVIATKPVKTKPRVLKEDEETAAEPVRSEPVRIEPPIQPPVEPGASREDREQVTAAPRPPEPVLPRETAAPKWYSPELFETPAGAWVHYNLNPMVKSIAAGGPRPRELKNRVKITLALGYFDDDRGLKYEGENYGRFAAVDPFLRSAIDHILTRDCEGRLQICGFEEKSRDDVGVLYFRGGEGGLIQEIYVFSGALHSRLDVTLNSKREEQKVRSEKANLLLANAFGDSDLVVYVGHSRNGGGPDFRPPYVVKGKVYYPFYHRERDGAHRMVRAIKDPNRRAQILAMMSCDSSEHFLRELRRAGPDLQLATIRGNLKSEDQMAGGLAAIDLFLRQGSLKGLPEFISGYRPLVNHLELRSGRNNAGH